MVIVPNLSRLSRDREERLRLLLDLDAIGVQLHSVELDRAVDLDDDWALVQQSIRATTDDVEKRKEIELFVDKPSEPNMLLTQQATTIDVFRHITSGAVG